MASFYETHAVLISSGKETKVWYGREGTDPFPTSPLTSFNTIILDIKKFLIDMMAHSDPNTKVIFN